MLGRILLIVCCVGALSACATGKPKKEVATPGFDCTRTGVGVCSARIDVDYTGTYLASDTKDCVLAFLKHARPEPVCNGQRLLYAQGKSGFNVEVVGCQKCAPLSAAQPFRSTLFSRMADAGPLVSQVQ